MTSCYWCNLILKTLREIFEKKKTKKYVVFFYVTIDLDVFLKPGQSVGIVLRVEYMSVNHVLHVAVLKYLGSAH